MQWMQIMQYNEKMITSEQVYPNNFLLNLNLRNMTQLPDKCV